MASSLCVTRLRKELRELQKNPVQNIRALPKETNILEWHYVIEGTKGSPYEGGWYHGIVTFPKEYPYKPPSIQMLTPNGRFKTSTPLCLSMSDFHPESWNPLWSVGTILMGLHSFMLESAPTQGSIVTTDSQKRKFAYESLEFNCKGKIFQELFPELIEVNKIEQEKRALLGPDHSFEASSGTSKMMSNTHEGTGRHLADQNNASWASILGLLAAIICCTWAILSFAI